MKKLKGAIPVNTDSDQLLIRILVSYLHRTKVYWDEPVYRALHGHARGKNLTAILKTIDSLPTEYADVEKYYVQSQFSAFIKKYPFGPSVLQVFKPEDAAWKKFQRAEYRCKWVNRRFLAKKKRWSNYNEILHVARCWISRVIGEEPNLEKIYDRCDFGPGASIGVHGNFTNLGRKLLSKDWSCTPTALSFAIPALYRNPHIRRWLSPDEGNDYGVFRDAVKRRVRLISHNKISFVPKSYKTFRSIATEPLLNGYLQKGVDSYLRERLKTVREADLDLSDQSLNCELARQGSLGGPNPYATLDLSAASDSISIELVRELLPPTWVEFLSAIRSRQYEYRGKVHTYHKFVSMGNGFCFPLETLIFASLCYACGIVNGERSRFRVYGDDIVIQQSLALVLIEVLRFCGFKTNPDKTFLIGPFRESCGKDWYNGLDVRPVYMSHRLVLNTDLFVLHNSLSRNSFRNINEDIMGLLKAVCPSEGVYKRPFRGTSDSAFEVSKDEFMSFRHCRWDRTTWAWSWREVVTTSIRDRLHGFDPSDCNMVEYIALLRGSSSSSPLSIRRKARASVRTRSYWGPEVR